MKWQVLNMIYGISDTHFNSDNVVKQSRGRFKSVKEHDDLIFSNWNKVIKDDDTVYVAGDLGNIQGEKLKKKIRKLKGTKILIKGNHDNETDDFYFNLGFSEVHDGLYFHSNDIIIAHEPPPVDGDYFIVLHGHLHRSVLRIDNFFNLSVDVNFYKPVPLEQTFKRASSLKKVRTSYGKEWYRNSIKEINF
jgi:calcineurin-like phosphoesterase family protein